MLKFFKRHYIVGKSKSDGKNRNFYYSTEVFFDTPNLLQQSMFSQRLEYFTFEYKRKLKNSTRFKNCCFKSGSYRIYISRLGLSRVCFAQKALSGKLVGFHKAIW